MLSNLLVYEVVGTTNSLTVKDFWKKLRGGVKWGWKTKQITVVMDNHQSHRDPDVVQEMARYKFKPLYLPSSSSWYSSIEHAWSVLKHYFG